MTGPLPNQVTVRPAALGVTFRRFAECDAGPVLALMRLSLGAGRVPRTEAFFRWKHLDNPFGTSIGWVAADSDGALVGLRMLQRWGLSAAERHVSAVRAVDTATAPAAQGQGIFRRLTLASVDAARAEDVDLVFNTPNKRSGAGYLKMGWIPVGKPGVWLRPVILGRDHLDDRDVDPFALTANATSRLHTSTSPAYWRWRYVDIPEFAYRMVTEGSARAVIRRQKRRDVEELTVAELLHPSSVRGARDAGRLLRRLANTAGVAMVSVCAPAPSVTAVALLAAGFVWTPLGPSVMTRGLSLRQLLRAPSRVSDWSFSIGDLEIF